MYSIGAFEAKTHLSALLDRVEDGESIVITRHGKPIARLVPNIPVRSEATVSDSVDALLRFRDEHPMSHSELKVLINEGRKY